jgi:hypothetical protein
MTFEEYLNKMGYSWNDFDHTYEMEGLIEQYANERINQSLLTDNVDTKPLDTIVMASFKH